jgi:hypothetical protein
MRQQLNTAKFTKKYKQTEHLTMLKPDISFLLLVIRDLLNYILTKGNSLDSESVLYRLIVYLTQAG